MRQPWQDTFPTLPLRRVFAEADEARLPLRVGALRGSDSNRFYVRHGFALVTEDECDNYYIRAARKPAHDRAED